MVPFMSPAGDPAVALVDGTLLTPDQVPDTNWKAVGTGDQDGDGQFDIVWQNIADGRTLGPRWGR
jgi:hypothetical protein